MHISFDCVVEESSEKGNQACLSLLTWRGLCGIGSIDGLDETRHREERKDIRW